MQPCSLNTSTIKRTHAGKEGFTDQSQWAIGIVAKVMFFDAQRSRSSTNAVRVHELFSINNIPIGYRLPIDLIGTATLNVRWKEH